MKALARRLRRLRRDLHRQTSRKGGAGFASLPEHLINMNRRRPEAICKNTSITSRSRCGALTDILRACCRIRGRAETEPSARAADSVWGSGPIFWVARTMILGWCSPLSGLGLFFGTG